MPQELRVVRCCECETFQSDIVKKSTNWRCKMCNLKQSLKRVYLMGTGKQCREFTQEMNRQRIQGQNGQESKDTDVKSEEECKELKPRVEVVKESKWNDLLETHRSAPDNSFAASKDEIANFFTGLE